jgi:hypothetical protein
MYMNHSQLKLFILDTMYYMPDIITWSINNIMKILNIIKREGKNEVKELSIYCLNSLEVNQAKYKY